MITMVTALVVETEQVNAVSMVIGRCVDGYWKMCGDDGGGDNGRYRG